MPQQKIDWDITSEADGSWRVSATVRRDCTTVYYIAQDQIGLWCLYTQLKTLIPGYAPVSLSEPIAALAWGMTHITNDINEFWA